MHRMKRKSEATSRGNFLLPDQFDLDMLRDTIEVGRDLDANDWRAKIRRLPHAGGARFLTTLTFQLKQRGWRSNCGG